MECCGHQPDGVNQVRGHAGEPGAMTTNGHASGGVLSASRRLRDGLGADLSVPEAEVDEGDDLASDGNPGDLSRTWGISVVLGDAGEVRPELRACSLALGRLDRGPAHQA